MESFSGDTEESTDDLPGRKKSKLKALKTRLFGRSKRTGREGNAKLSQSASDITAGKGLGSNEDLVCSQGMMGSRALSHDSIFLADQVLADTEPARVLSQENVHSKIKALQIKLQQQKMHLGPPPLVVPIRRPEDPSSRSEDGSLPHSPPEFSGGDVRSLGALSKITSQPSSHPLSPIPTPALTRPLTPTRPLPPTVPSISSVIEPPLDFSSPPQFTPCLDTSAARHRMSVKPRNQRVSTKRRLATTDYRSHSHTPNNHPEPVREEEERLGAQDEVTPDTEQGEADVPITAQSLPSKSPEVAPITSEAAPTSSNLTFPQQDRVPSVPSQILRVKPQRPVDAASSERPRSSFIESELMDRGKGDFEKQVMSHDKKNTLKKAGMSENSSNQVFGSVMASRSPSVHQQVQGEMEGTRGIKRPAQGSGSFHFSANNREGERPRSSSFVGVLEQTEARHKTLGGAGDKAFSSLREKEGLRDLHSRGGQFALGRLKQEGAPPKSSVLPWDRGDSLKKTEPATASKTAATDMSTQVGEEVESGQEEVEEAVEAQEVQEEEGKTAFGIKLRSTTEVKRLRSDSPLNHLSKPPVCEEQCDKQKRQEISDNAGYVSKKLPTNTSGTPSTSKDIRVTDQPLSGFSLPVKNNLPSTSNPVGVETALTVPQEPQPAPQTASPEVSWMSLAMEKTRSLQQLFTSKFPRDFTGIQTAARPQAQVQPMNQTETQSDAQLQTQTVKMQQSATLAEGANQPSTDTVKAATVQSRIQAQTVKPSLMSMQQKTPTAPIGLSNTSKEAQTSKQTNESQSHRNTTQSSSQCPSHPPVQTSPWTTQPPLCSSTRTETSSQFAQGSAIQCLAQCYLSSGQPAAPQQPPWSNRGLHPTNQPKPATSVSTTSSAAAPPQVSASGRGEREADLQDKEASSLSGRRAGWAGSVSRKAAFLEKRAEWATQPGAKGVELKQTQTDVQTSGESPAFAKTTPLISKDARQGPGVKLAESSPTKVPDRPREDKWLLKNMASSSPSSSPTQPSVLQSMSDSGQPSWMELAKRKSMAWSDKTTD